MGGALYWSNRGHQSTKSVEHAMPGDEISLLPFPSSRWRCGYRKIAVQFGTAFKMSGSCRARANTRIRGEILELPPALPVEATNTSNLKTKICYPLHMIVTLLYSVSV